MEDKRRSIFRASPSETFCKAISRGDKQKIEAMIQTGFKAEDVNVNGKTLLELAIRPRLGPTALEIVKLLLSHGVNINCRSETGETALHCAVQLGKMEIVAYLLDNQADIDAQDNEGKAPLHNAIDFCYTLMVISLVKAGANLEIRTQEGVTPMQTLYGSVMWNILLIEFLALHGARFDTWLSSARCKIPHTLYLLDVFVKSQQQLHTRSPFSEESLHPSLPNTSDSNEKSDKKSHKADMILYLQQLGFIFRDLDFPKTVHQGRRNNYNNCCRVARRSVLPLGDICRYYIRSVLYQRNGGRSVVLQVKENSDFHQSLKITWCSRTN